LTIKIEGVEWEVERDSLTKYFMSISGGCQLMRCDHCGDEFLTTEDYREDYPLRVIGDRIFCCEDCALLWDLNAADTQYSAHKDNNFNRFI